LLNTMISHLSVSHNAFIMSWHQVQDALSIAYTDCCTHQVQHPPMIDCLLFIFIVTSGPLNAASASSMPLYMIDHHRPALNHSSKVMCPSYISLVVIKLTDE
jgi:hypothetical protein